MDYKSSNCSLKDEFRELDGKRSTIREKVEEYAHWTIPTIFPSSSDTDNTKDIEMVQAAGSIGARAVNHLSNRIASVLFIPNRPFFRIDLDEERTAALIGTGETDEAGISAELSKIEYSASSRTSIAQHRYIAVEALRHLLVTGNGLLSYVDIAKPILYNFMDYVWQRDLMGNVYRIIIRDSMNCGRLSPEFRDRLVTSGAFPDAYDDKSKVELYTVVYRSPRNRMARRIDHDDWVWRVAQEVEGHEIPLKNADLNPYYEKDSCPFVPLTWSLARGDDYGRGLVEEYAYSFKSHAMMSAAYLQNFIASTDWKTFIQPGAVSGPAELKRIVESPTGSYHVLPKDSLWRPEMPQVDLVVAASEIQRLEREIAQAFMLTSATTRDAERVTAEEIRMQIQELETSNAGIYSKLAYEWQIPLANILLRDIQVDGPLKELKAELKIITGLESLSKVGELEAVVQYVGRLAALTASPPEALMRIDMGKFLRYTAGLENLDPAKFLKSEEQVQQELAQMQAQAQQEQERQAALQAASQSAAQA